MTTRRKSILIEFLKIQIKGNGEVCPFLIKLHNPGDKPELNRGKTCSGHALK
jgi:hypothetical protein